MKTPEEITKKQNIVYYYNIQEKMFSKSTHHKTHISGYKGDSGSICQNYIFYHNAIKLTLLSGFQTSFGLTRIMVGIIERMS